MHVVALIRSFGTMFTNLRRAGVLALGLAVATACSSEHATAPAAQPSSRSVTVPQAGAQSPDLLGTVGSLLGGLQLVTGLQRTTPLAAPITVTKTIGLYGGVLAIPQAGVSVIIPYGALTQPTTITMTARAGSLVAYDFAPHGITFAKPLVFTQSLSGTNATLLSVPFLRLAYYTDPSLLGSVTGTVSELIGGITSLLTWTFTAPIKHFSGYMVSCGRD
jgi:hypothetical protein